MEFTVLMPVYKAEKPHYFAQALNSIYSNSSQASEVLIVCDGPLTDELDSVLQDFSEYKTLNILRLDRNYGIVTALNRGLKIAKYDLIIRCDSDDINHNDRFKRLCFELAKGVDVVGSSIQEIDPEGRVINCKFMPKNHKDILARMRYRNPINHMSVAYNRKTVLAFGGYAQIAFKEDYALWVKLMAKGVKFYNIPDCLVSARVDDNFHKRRKNIAAIFSEFSLYRYMIKTNFIGVFAASLFCSVRIIGLLLPVPILRGFYQFFLRHRG